MKLLRKMKKIKTGYNKGKNNGQYNDGRTLKQHYCKEIGCNNKISYKNWQCGKGRCASCAQAGKRSWKYIDGRTLKKYHCEICNIEIKNIYAKRCKKCININKDTSIYGSKGENNPMFGVRRYGKDSPGWIDGRSPLRDSIRSLTESINWRNKVFQRDNYTCQECGDDIGHNLNAHHKKPFAKILSEFLEKYNQFSPVEDKETLVKLAIKYKSFWNITNGKTLCEDCHKKITRR